jgi:hypothetical protein
MIKTRKLATLVILSIFLLSVATAQSTNPWSASPTEAEKNTFDSLDDVYVRSGKLCQPAETVDLYIVENNDNWEEGDELEDVRGAPEPIVLINNAIPLTRIWENPDGGDYDIVIDCEQDGEYNFGDEVDDFEEAGLEVVSVAGEGIAEKGSNDPEDHQWRYDPEEIDLENEMMQIRLGAEGEDIELINITISASGNGDDTEINALEIYVDENNNGRLDDTEILIGDSQPAFEDNNGETTVDLDYFLENGVEESLLIVYVMNQDIEEGEFILTIESLMGIGGDSDSTIEFSGFPLESGIKTVLPEKTCLGELTLTLNPNPVEPDSIVRAQASGLENCDSFEVSLRTNPCGSSVPQEVGTCEIEDGECTVSFSPETERTYHLCVDKNEDGDAVDFGEFSFQDLMIEEEQEEEEETDNQTMTEEDEDMEEEDEEEKENNDTGPTGAVGGLQELSETSSFFILLEVTLLLILFVLVMILFRLKPPAPASETKEEEKEEEKEEDKKEEKKEEKEKKGKKK